jgi:zinc-ribbon domain
MALIKCPDCGAQVSDAATSCPSCARPIAGLQLQIKGGPGASWILKALAIVLVLLLLFLFLIVAQGLDQIGGPAVIARPVWAPMHSRVAFHPMSAVVALALSIAIVAVAVHFGRRKGKLGE